MKNNLIVIPFNLPWEWSTDYLNQTALILSKKNIVICYLLPEAKTLKELIVSRQKLRLIRKLNKNLYLIYPVYWLPLIRFKIVLNFNIKFNLLLLKIFTVVASTIKGTRQKILWVFYPKDISIANFLEKEYFLIYDCVDFFSTGTKKEKSLILRDEKELVQKANLVVANSTVLQKYLSQYRGDIDLVPQGFRTEDFTKKEYTGPKIRFSKPTIGFVGAVNHRIDYDLLLSLAKKNKKWNFVIWGPILEREKIDKKTWKKMKALFELPNVTCGLSENKKEIPEIIKQFDIAIIPYDISQDFNKYCYPMKVLEYFYLGKPVVSTPIEELKRFPKFVKIGKNSKEWERLVKQILITKWPQKHQIEQKQLAIDNNWNNKIRKICRVISN